MENMAISVGDTHTIQLHIKSLKQGGKVPHTFNPALRRQRQAELLSSVGSGQLDLQIESSTNSQSYTEKQQQRPQTMQTQLAHRCAVIKPQPLHQGHPRPARWLEFHDKGLKDCHLCSPASCFHHVPTYKCSQRCHLQELNSRIIYQVFESKGCY